MELSKLFLFYIIIILFLYFTKQNLFQFSDLPEDKKRRKFIMLSVLSILIAIIVYFINIFYEYYFE